MVPSLTPYDPPFPKNGGSYAPKIREWPYLLSATGDLIHFMFGSRVGFSGSADRMALFPVTANPSWWQADVLDNFERPSGSFDLLI